jgi:hypothetical protein
VEFQVSKPPEAPEADIERERIRLEQSEKQQKAQSARPPPQKNNAVIRGEISMQQKL